MQGLGNRKAIALALAGGGAVVCAGLALSLSPASNPGQDSAPSPSSSVTQSISPSPSPTAEQPASPLGTSGLGTPYVFGYSDAPTIVSIWEDTECPSCAAFEFDTYDVLSAAIAEGNVQVHYYVAPTDKTGSMLSTLGLACAADQEKFKDMQLLLYTNQRPAEDVGFTPEQVTELAEAAGVPNMEEFAECFESERYEDYALSIVELGVEAGLQQTPTVFINDEIVTTSAMAWEDFVKRLGLDVADFPYPQDEG